MGVLDELGYEVGQPNAVQRGVQRIVMMPSVSRLSQKVVYAVDRPLYRWSNGRLSATQLVAGMPVLMLTTTGAKSGEPRTMPLVGLPLGDAVAVIGSNFGTEKTPGWVYNLEAEPRATLGWREREVDVVARPATDEEYEETFRVASACYPGYAEYRERAAHRTIRVFVLEPAG